MAVGGKLVKVCFLGLKDWWERLLGFAVGEFTKVHCPVRDESLMFRKVDLCFTV